MNFWFDVFVDLQLSARTMREGCTQRGEDIQIVILMKK